MEELLSFDTPSLSMAKSSSSSKFSLSSSKHHTFGLKSRASLQLSDAITYNIINIMLYRLQWTQYIIFMHKSKYNNLAASVLSSELN